MPCLLASEVVGPYDREYFLLNTVLRMTSTIDIISLISERFVELTAAEKQIAQFILDDIGKVTEMPIAEIARLTGTSQATVTRFAKALGCKDVRELKLRLAQSLAVGQRFIQDVPDLEGAQGIYESIISVLDINKRVIDMDTLKQAVEWLKGARQILSIGMGGGATICAQEVQYRFFRLGLPVVSQSDGLLVRMMCSAVSAQDVVVVLSLGGYTPEIVESASIARQYGAKVIAITPGGTPVASQADLLLPLLVRENDYIYKPSTSRYAMLAMIDVLASELAVADKARTKDRLRRIKLSLDSYRGGIDRQPLGD
ncbi:Uncharacterized HTH-type transcriptional regulator ybbH [Tatumella ptyseos]|nr:Uncharacterized HTH-type transcriptional regulator ybbH [Tatumella ptyseos]